MKIIYFLTGLLIMTFSACSEENSPQLCDPLKAVELLVNNPRIGPSKTETGYYEVVREDEKFIYFGYRILNLKRETELNPFYKTDKKAYYSIQKRINKIDTWKAESLIKSWYLEHYSDLKYYSIQIAQTIEIKFLENKISKQYDANCFGWIEFYYSQMEKSNESNIDSAMTNHTLRKFNYNTLITEGKNIKWLKSK